MKYILDTKILLQLVELNHSHHKQAGEALKTLRRQNNRFYVLLQSVFESWNVCTRPADKKGVGLSIAKSDVHLKRSKRFLKLLPPHRRRLSKLARTRRQTFDFGVQVHDTKIVAAMKTHNIQNPPTFSAKDLKRCPDIKAAEPKEA